MKRDFGECHFVGVLRIIKIISMVFLLSACSFFDKPVQQSSLSPVTPVQETPPVSPVTPVAKSPENMPVDKVNNQQAIIECKNALQTLSKSAPGVYAKKKAIFDALLRNASQYGSVRGQISTETRDTVDALYTFKTNKLCSEIESEAMNSLIDSANRAVP